MGQSSPPPTFLWWGMLKGCVSFSQTGGGSPLTYKGRNLNHVHGGEARIKPGTAVAPVRFPQTRERDEQFGSKQEELSQ